MGLSVDLLFPVLNEHLRLEKGIRGTMKYLRENFDAAEHPYRLLILDNGSDDDTPEIGKKLAAEFPEVEYIRIEQRGVGIAFRTGVEYSRADIVGYMDIDLSTDIHNLQKMIRIFADDPFGRLCQCVPLCGPFRDDRPEMVPEDHVQRAADPAAYGFPYAATDAICGFTFLRREKAEQLVRECYNDNGWFYMIEFLLRAERDGMRICDLPVEWTEDYNTTVNVGKTVRNYLKNIRRLKKAFALEDRKMRG
jgi:glycosyltransferase involved in cell wall biosynthesis